MFRGLPPGYTKSLERKVSRLESILNGLANLSLTPQQIEALKGHVLSQWQGKDGVEMSNTLQKYLPPAVDNFSTNVVATTESLANLPSPPTSVDGGNPPETTPNGLLSVNENSVITHVGVTNGLHLITPCEIVDQEIWYGRPISNLTLGESLPLYAPTENKPNVGHIPGILINLYTSSHPSIFASVSLTASLQTRIPTSSS